MSTQFLYDNLAKRQTKSITVLLLSILGDIGLEDGVDVFRVYSRTSVCHLHCDSLFIVAHAIAECDTTGDGVLEGIADEIAKHLSNAVDVGVEHYCLCRYISHQLD